MATDLLARRGPRPDPSGRRRRGVPAAAPRRRGPGWIRAAALGLLLALAAACGPERAVEVRTEPPRTAPAEREDGAPDPEDEASGADVATPDAAAPGAGDPGAGTPRRQASEHLVAEGVRALDTGDLSGAARRLEEAIRVDGSNGMAYYHLARVRVAAGREPEARGLLERAIELLRPYPERREAAERLRDGLAGGD